MRPPSAPSRARSALERCRHREPPSRRPAGRWRSRPLASGSPEPAAPAACPSLAWSRRFPLHDRARYARRPPTGTAGAASDRMGDRGGQAPPVARATPPRPPASTRQTLGARPPHPPRGRIPCSRREHHSAPAASRRSIRLRMFTLWEQARHDVATERSRPPPNAITASPLATGVQYGPCSRRTMRR